MIKFFYAYVVVFHHCLVHVHYAYGISPSNFLTLNVFGMLIKVNGFGIYECIPAAIYHCNDIIILWIPFSYVAYTFSHETLLRRVRMR